jgi:hypothetical protein
MVAADKTNEHGRSSANPPAASLYGERNMIAIKILPDLNLMTILDGPLLAQSGHMAKHRRLLSANIRS